MSLGARSHRGLVTSESRRGASCCAAAYWALGTPTWARFLRVLSSSRSSIAVFGAGLFFHILPERCLIESAPDLLETGDSLARVLLERTETGSSRSRPSFRSSPRHPRRPRGPFQPWLQLGACNFARALITAGPSGRSWLRSRPVPAGLCAEPAQRSGWRLQVSDRRLRRLIGHRWQPPAGRHVHLLQLRPERRRQDAPCAASCSQP